MTTASIHPTEQDGEWVGEALAGVLPDELDSRTWLQGNDVEFEGKLCNSFTLKGQDLHVMISIAPIYVQGSDDKKAGYHIISFRRDGDKVKRPNSADISRVRSAFICRELKPGEQVYEGSVGDSKAHHIMCVFTYSPILIVGA